MLIILQNVSEGNELLKSWSILKVNVKRYTFCILSLSNIPEDAIYAFKNHVLEVPQSQRQTFFFESKQKYIDLHGEYFE